MVGFGSLWALLVVLYAQVAQSVEQQTENLRVGGSIPSLGISLLLSPIRFGLVYAAG